MSEKKFWKKVPLCIYFFINSDKTGLFFKNQNLSAVKGENVLNVKTEKVTVGGVDVKS